VAWVVLWLGTDVVKEFNPFQVSGSAIGNLQIQNHRRERFRNIFFAVLAAHVALFLTLLIQGCRSQTASQAPKAPEITASAPQH
jgi:hypothetical protein